MRISILFTLLLTLSVGGPALAQHEARMNRPFFEDLDITDEQREALREIQRVYGPELRSTRNDTSLSDSDRALAVQALKKDRDKAISEVLGEEAFADFLAAREALRAEGRERHAEMVVALDLNDGQAEAMRAIHEKYHELNIELRDSELTEAEKQDARQRLRLQKDEEIRDVLTEEQYAAFEAERKKRKLRMRMKKLHGGKPSMGDGANERRQDAEPARSGSATERH